MSSENAKPDQIQASVAAALSRLRGDLGPSAGAAPQSEAPRDAMRSDRGRPANDLRADPFFKAIQTPPPPSADVASAPRGPIPMTPFARMQASQDAPPSDPPSADTPASSPEPSPERSAEPSSKPELPSMPEPSWMPEPSSMAEPPVPVMPEPTRVQDLVAMPEPAPASAMAPQPAPAPSGGAGPLSRIMRSPGVQSSTLREPAQRDLLAGLPPPPISEPLTGDTESSAMRRRQRNRRLLAAVLAIVVIALGAWLWSGGKESQEVPVIAAEAAPEKVKPADVGGLEVPNQNVQVLENMGNAETQPEGETVMPLPEQPVTPPAPAAQEAPTTEEAPAVVEGATVQNDVAAAPEVPAADAPPAPEVPLTTAPLPEPGDDAVAATIEDVPPAPQAEPAAPAAEPTRAAEAPLPPSSEQAAAAPAPDAPQPDATPAATPEPAATQEAAVTPAVGSTRVQLAAGKSEDAVQKEWARLQKAHPDLLSALSLTVQRVDKGADGVFYRLQAGPLADKTAAKQLCASLKQQNQDCIVVK